MLAASQTQSNTKHEVSGDARAMNANHCLASSAIGSTVGLVVRALAFQQCGPSSISAPGVMWIEFVGSLLCYETFSPGYSGFPLSSKTSI